MLDLFKSLLESLKNRIENPFFGTFVISCILYNWDSFGIILFSQMDFQQKIPIIEEITLNKKTFWLIPQSILHFIILPSLFAILYICLLPYPTTWIYKAFKFWEKKFKEIKVSYELQRILSREEADRIMSKDIEIRRENERLLNRIKDLEGLIERENLQKHTNIDQKHHYEWDKEYNEIKEKNVFKSFPTIAKTILNGYIVGAKQREHIAELTMYDLIENDSGKFTLTEKAKYFYKKILDEDIKE